MTTQLDRVAQDEELEKMASGLHSVICMRLGRHLANYVEERKLGYVLDSSATFNFQDGLPKRQPDVSFVSLEKMPVPLDDELTFAPDIAAEVVSKNDTDYEIEAKVRQYQQAGVKLIWVIHPVSQTVDVYHLNTGLSRLNLIDLQELDGEEIITGFKLAVKTLFEYQQAKK